MEKMSLFLLLIGSVFASSIAKAQSSCTGVFLTAEDFSAGKLYYVHTGKHESTSSDYDFSFSTKKKIFINQSGSINEIDKNNIYAIKDCSGTIIRLYKGGHYTLLNLGKDVPLYKVTQNPVSKGDYVTYKYYFSKDSNSDIKQLSYSNLEVEFPNSDQFNHVRDEIYRTNEKLGKEIF